MGAFADKYQGKVTYAQRADMRLPWWATKDHAPNLVDTDKENDVSAWLAAAGMEWKAQPVKVYTKLADGTYAEIDGFRAMECDDNNAVLSIVDESYKPVQPHEIVAGWQERISAAGLRMATVGTMKGRRILHASAAMRGQYAQSIIGPDKVEHFLNISTSFDKTKATRLAISSVCAVCENTIEAGASAAERNGLLLRQSHRQQFSMSDMLAAIEQAEGSITERVALFNALVDKKISDDECRDYFARDILQIDPADIDRTGADGKPLISTRTRNMLDALLSSYKRGPGADARLGSAWGAFNAVTNWVDNEAATRDTTGDGQHMARMYTAKFGTGAATKQRALEGIMARVKVAA